MTAKINRELIQKFYGELDERSKETLDAAAEKVAAAKKRSGKVAVVTGSGPNLHEGVTTLIAELIEKGVVDGVTTSSAVISHEMGGALDRVKMCGAAQLGLDEKFMPRGNVFEFTDMTDEELEELSKEMILDRELLAKRHDAEGHFVIKAAANMAYPMGLRTEKLAEEIHSLCRQSGLPFEAVAGWGCDRRTMLGAGAEKGVPVLVTIPQLVGGGHVGMAVGDSIPVAERSRRISAMLGSSDVIIESAVALTQEIHDGPFETYTGHGIWSWWQGQPVYSLREKTLIRFDLDENLRRAQDLQRSSAMIQEAIDKGLPKTKISKIPFRMEMSAFARHEGSLPVIGDIGMIWPAFALKIADALGIGLDFMSYKQETDDGRAMREWIVKNVRPLDRGRMLAKFREWQAARV
ncbi:MAG: hypothetical protein SOR75_07970 [Synergistes jonesii]|uniref:hypothetical protein n=1 Tax=Synergistes jonesii TaxID=2754 RepID=UPI002A75885D|nr:hypothetical protein [Synergistes jonesii]MDY2985250.1 hypothetical protein [Synergistes jonesii]